MRSFVVISLCVGLVGCAPDLRDDHPFDGNGKCKHPVTKEEVDCASIPLVIATELNGVHSLVVDATNKTSQIYVDLDEARELKSDAAFETNDWDLSFKRFEIASNGGTSNPGGVVEIAVLKGSSFDSLTQAPAEGYQQDAAGHVFNTVEGGWYAYDLGVHKLVTNAELLYVVKSSRGAYFKLAMGSYYDDTGTAARISFKYAAISAP